MKNKYNQLLKNGIKLIIFIIMISFFIYFGNKDFNIDVSDNVKFSNEYKDISMNNIYVYARGEEINKLLNDGSGIVFFGFSSNIWSHYYADYLNEVAMDNEIDKIYYYDFLRDRAINNDLYEKIVKRLKKYLIINDLGRVDLAAPSVVIVKDGSVIYFNDEMQSIHGEIKPEDYFTDYKKSYIIAEFSNAIKLYKGELE